VTLTRLRSCRARARPLGRGIRTARAPRLAGRICYGTGGIFRLLRVTVTDPDFFDGARSSFRGCGGSPGPWVGPRLGSLGSLGQPRSGSGRGGVWSVLCPLGRECAHFVPTSPFWGWSPAGFGRMESPALEGFSGDGRYWARTSDPQLVDSERCARLFVRVRSRRMVERKLRSERTLQRTRTNAERCHCCHGRAATDRTQPSRSALPSTADRRSLACASNKEGAARRYDALAVIVRRSCAVLGTHGTSASRVNARSSEVIGLNMDSGALTRGCASARRFGRDRRAGKLALARRCERGSPLAGRSRLQGRRRSDPNRRQPGSDRRRRRRGLGGERSRSRGETDRPRHRDGHADGLAM
jgi:hypothetical protein